MIGKIFPEKFDFVAKLQLILIPTKDLPLFVTFLCHFVTLVSHLAGVASYLYGRVDVIEILYIIHIKLKKGEKTMNIQPLADRVLVLPKPAEEKTVGGIIIPDTAKEKPLQGEVVAAGNGTKDEEMVVKVGDQVLYGKYSGTELEYEGVKYLIMRQSDVLAILK